MRPVDYRYNQFTDTSAAVHITGERHRIPTTSPWMVKLREAPVKADPSTLSMRVFGILAAAITAADATTITVFDGQGAWFANGDVLTIDSEKLQVTADPSGDTLAVSRGYGGTTATTHEWGTPVYIEDSMEEVNATPAAGQYWPDYYTEADGDSGWNSGEIQFHEDDGGKLVSVDYYGKGAPVDARAVAVSLPDHIVEGLTITPPASGFKATVGTGKAWISNELVEVKEATDLFLQPSRAQLAYIGLDGLPGIIPASFPAADAGTVCRWIIDGGATIASTVGSNDLTASGSITPVLGWASDLAGKGDGSTGCYVSDNSDGFPTGAAVREIDVVFTLNSISGNQIIFGYGTSAQAFGLRIMSGVACFWWYSTTSQHSLAYTFEAGKTYYVAMQYDGTKVALYVNGVLVATYTTPMNTGAGVLGLLYSHINAADFSSATLYYAEIRNVLRTPAEIAAISNALLLPCRYSVTPNLLANGSFEQDLTGWTRTSLTAAAVSQGYDGGRCMQVTAGASGNNYKQAYTIVSGKTYTLQFKAKVNALGGSSLTVGAYSGSGFISGASQALSVVDTDYTTYTMTFTPSTDGTDIRIQANGTITAGDYLIDDIILVEGAVISSEVRDVRNILPAGTHSLGRVRTDDTGIIEVRREYRDGVREGIAAGNRMKLLGRQYFSGATTLSWLNNPFGTRQVEAVYKYSEDAGGLNESDVVVTSVDATAGIIVKPTSATPFSIAVTAGGATIVNGSSKTSGYIACYGRVVEDVV